MTLKDYHDHITTMLNKQPELASCEVIYSKDDEGNNFQITSFYPSVMYTEEVDYHIDVYTEADIKEQGEDVGSFIKVVCLN